MESRHRAHDDEGRAIQVLNPAVLCDWPIDGDARVSGLIERLAHVSRGSNTIWLVVWAVPSFVLFGVVFLAVFLGARRFGLPGWTPWAVFFGGPFVMSHTLARAQRAVYGREMAGLIIEEGLCPACGYNLVGLRPAEGLLRCPECAAAWRAQRVKRAEAFAPSALMGSVATVLRKGRASAGIFRDDKGRPVALIDVRLTDRRRHARNHADAAAVERLIRASSRAAQVEKPLRQRLALAAFVVAGAMALVLIVVVGMRPGALMFALGPLAFALLGVGLLLTGMVLSPRRVARVFVEEGICPGCARDLPNEAIGKFRKCAGCGCEWADANRMTATNPASPKGP